MLGTFIDGTHSTDLLQSRVFAKIWFLQIARRSIQRGSLSELNIFIFTIASYYNLSCHKIKFPSIDSKFKFCLKCTYTLHFFPENRLQEFYLVAKKHALHLLVTVNSYVLLCFLCILENTCTSKVDNGPRSPKNRNYNEGIFLGVRFVCSVCMVCMQH